VEGQLKRSLVGGSRATRASLVASRALGEGEGEWSDDGSIAGSDAGSLADLDQESNIVELRIAVRRAKGNKVQSYDGRGRLAVFQQTGCFFT
jgi:hypothetical protein